MRHHRSYIHTLLTPLFALAASTALCQNYPTKPVRLVTGGAGGGNDVASRLLAPDFSVSLNQPVIIDNRSNSVVPGQILSMAPPDGYTLLLYNNGLWTLPLLQDVPYDMARDFLPISAVASSPNIMVVNPSVAAKTVRELIALAKAKPGELNYASSGNGATNHLAAELFKSMAGVNIVRVAYKNAALITTDLIGGQVQLSFSTAGSSSPHVKSGKLRALAVTSAHPSALFPGMPTVAASGLPGYETASIQGVFAPARTSATIINRLNQDLVRVLGRPELKEKFLAAAVEAGGSSAQQFGATVKSEMERLGKLIKTAGIRAE